MWPGVGPGVGPREAFLSQRKRSAVADAHLEVAQRMDARPPGRPSRSGRAGRRGDRSGSRTSFEKTGISPAAAAGGRASPNRSSKSDAPTPTVTVRSAGPVVAPGCRSRAAGTAGRRRRATSRRRASRPRRSARASVAASGRPVRGDDVERRDQRRRLLEDRAGRCRPGGRPRTRRCAAPRSPRSPRAHAVSVACRPPPHRTTLPNNAPARRRPRRPRPHRRPPRGSAAGSGRASVAGNGSTSGLVAVGAAGRQPSDTSGRQAERGRAARRGLRTAWPSAPGAP